MLYDNALLTRLYLHGWLVTGEPRFRQVLDETVAYVQRDLRQPEGGFSSAEDADSEGVEGRFYVWTDDEVRAVLGEQATSALDWYGFSRAGTSRGHHPEPAGPSRCTRATSRGRAARRTLFEHRAETSGRGSTTRSSPSGTP